MPPGNCDIPTRGLRVRCSSSELRKHGGGQRSRTLAVAGGPVFKTGCPPLGAALHVLLLPGRPERPLRHLRGFSGIGPTAPPTIAWSKRSSKSGWGDSNPRSPTPEAGALPSWATSSRVGTGRFERPAARPPAVCSTKLSYVPSGSVPTHRSRKWSEWLPLLHASSAPERNRTSDFRIRSATLYPLSYEGMSNRIGPARRASSSPILSVTTASPP